MASNIENRKKVIFYIYQYRKIFKKIIIIYMLCLLCILFIFYKVKTRPSVTYYAASENGRLKKLNSYTKQQAEQYIKELQSQKNINN